MCMHICSANPLAQGSAAVQVQGLRCQIAHHPGEGTCSVPRRLLICPVGEYVATVLHHQQRPVRAWVAAAPLLVGCLSPFVSRSHC